MDIWRRVRDAGAVGDDPVLASVDSLEEQILLVRGEDGRLHAVGPACPHTGNPLTLGTVLGSTLECRHHCYVYDLLSGDCVTPGGPLAGRLVVHAIREDGDLVEVRIADPAIDE